MAWKVGECGERHDQTMASTQISPREISWIAREVNYTNIYLHPAPIILGVLLEAF